MPAVLVMVHILGLLPGPVGSRPAWADDELDFGLETHRLSQIEIRGNTTFGSNELKQVLQIQEPSWKRPLAVPRYQPSLVNSQLRLLASYYRNRGFHQVTVRLDSISTVAEKGDVLHIHVEEGALTVIDRVEFIGMGSLAEEKLREVMLLLEGESAPADLNAFGGDIYALRNLYRDATYLNTIITPEMTINPDPDSDRNLAIVRYLIRPGRSYTIGKITLSGNDQTQENLLTRELKIEEGAPLQWRSVEESRRQLLATSLFRDVQISPVMIDTLNGIADLNVHVVERRPAYYELGVGMGSLERIRVLAAWGHHNLWGTGRRLQVRGQGSWNLEDVVGNPISFDQGQLNYRTDVTYVNPRLRGSRYSFDLENYLRRETRGESGLNLLIYGFNVGTTWKASRRVTNNAFLGLKITDPKVHPYAPEDLQQRFAETGVDLTQTRSLNWAIYIDHRDDLFRPTTGMYAVGTTKFAGGVMGGDYSFFQWTAAWHNYHRFPLGGTVALRLMLGGARPYGRSLDLGPAGVPYDDRFFAGGASTVRGYDHNRLGPQIVDQEELDYLNYTSDVLLPDNPSRGGNYLMLTNVEWRFPLPLLKRWKLASVLFFEGGNVWERLSALRMRGFRLTSLPGEPDDPASTKVWDYRYSFGTGIRLDTPFGPVRVDVGFPLKRARYKGVDKDYKDPSSVWHFSLGYPF